MITYNHINEHLWSGIIHRSETGDRRKEDGVEVHTDLGVDIWLQDPSRKYDKFIETIINSDDNIMYILNTRDMNKNEIAKIDAKDKDISGDQFYYLISKTNHFVVSFDNCEEFEILYEKPISQHDYRSMCKGITEKLKPIGDNIVYVSNRAEFKKFSDKMVFNDDWNWCRGGYNLLLVDENTTYNFSIDQTEDYDFYELFYETMWDEFPELKYIPFIVWSYTNYSDNIALPLNYETLKKAEEYIQFAKKWFENYD